MALTNEVAFSRTKVNFLAMPVVGLTLNYVEFEKPAGVIDCLLKQFHKMRLTWVTNGQPGQNGNPSLTNSLKMK